MRLLCALACVVVLVCADAYAQPRVERGTRTRGLTAGWGHSWRPGVPGFGKTRSRVAFVAFHPRMGWFVTDRLELFGEGTVLAYYDPGPEVSLGLAGLAGRFHFRTNRDIVPYLTGGAGLIWTTLDIAEIDRLFNFQLFYGGGLRLLRHRNPGVIVELRNHHISNAGTAGANLGLNAATLVAGIEWILRR